MVDENNKKSNISPKQRWKNAANKFRHATITDDHKLGTLSDNLIDCVRVRIIEEEYLEEVALGKITRHNNSSKQEYHMLKMTPEELEKHRFFYDKKDHRLVDNNNNTITTIGKTSKKIQNTQAFVMSKEGYLYCATHTGAFAASNPKNLSHASFLGGKPAEMAGLIGVNENGKISLLSGNSGHYVPDKLDMYRSIKKIQQSMPDVMLPDCAIQIYEQNNDLAMPLKQFMYHMEKIGTSGKAVHQEMREARVKEVKQFSDNLRNAALMRIISNSSDLGQALIRLSSAEKTELTELLKNPLFSVVMINKRDNKPYPLNLIHSSIKMLSFGQVKAVQVLLESGIGNRKDFIDINPLYCAAISGKIEMVKAVTERPEVARNINRSDIEMSIDYVRKNLPYKKDVLNLLEETITSYDKLQISNHADFIDNLVRPLKQAAGVHANKPILPPKPAMVSKHANKPILPPKPVMMSAHIDKPILSQKPAMVSKHANKPILPPKPVMTSAHTNKPILPLKNTTIINEPHNDMHQEVLHKEAPKTFIANLIDKTKKKVLPWAISQNNRIVVKLILNNSDNSLKVNALNMAAQSGKKNIVTLILNKMGKDISKEDKLKTMKLAANKIIVQLILNDINAKNGESILPDKQKNHFTQALKNEALALNKAVKSEQNTQSKVDIKGQKDGHTYARSHRF